MTTTYDITGDVGKVRLIIGDTDIADAHFTDEEIQYFITSEGSVNLGAAGALESWAAAYATNPDNESIGGYSYSQSISKKMLDLANRLREGDANVPAMTWAEPDLMGTSEGDT